MTGARCGGWTRPGVRGVRVARRTKHHHVGVGTALGLGALAVAALVHLAVITIASRRLGPASMVGLRLGVGGPEDELPWKVVRPLFVAVGLAIPVVGALRLAAGASAGAWEVAGEVVITSTVAGVEWILFRTAAEDRAE